MGMSQRMARATMIDVDATPLCASTWGIPSIPRMRMVPVPNERLVGRARCEHRADIVLATKFGILMVRTARRGVDGSPRYVKKACDASLMRLGVDVIDLITCIASIPGAGRGLGWCAEGTGRRRKGSSHRSLRGGTATIRRAHKVHPLRRLQSEYSLWNRKEPELEVIPVCRELGIGFVPFSPLGRGFLSGGVTSVDALPADDLRKVPPAISG